VSSIDEAFAALSDPTLRAVIDLLRKRSLRAGEIAEQLEVSPPALSRHLRVLRRAGLIVDEEPEHDARVRLYRLNPRAFGSLKAWLGDVEGFRGEQLESLRKGAERASARRRK